jgi:hypothetical protein
MKKIMENFKTFLTEAQKSDYEAGDELVLFHYAPVDAPVIIVDPKYFADRAKRSSFTMREYQTSTVPRTFWYVDPQQRERQVASGRQLYQATIPAGEIYDFRNDPEGYKAKHAHPIYKLRKGEEWNTMLEDIRDSYAGVYYSLNAFDVVSLFIPYEATRVSPEEQAHLEGE